MLEPGEDAPTVTADNQYGESVTLDFAYPTVLFFYPADFTDGCTVEAREFQSVLPQFREGGIAVYGVSTDDAETHAEFVEAEGLLFDLLADPDGEVATAFGVATTDGRAARRTVVLAEGRVVETYDPPRADPSGHAETVLRDVRNEFVQGG